MPFMVGSVGFMSECLCVGFSIYLRSCGYSLFVCSDRFLMKYSGYLVFIAIGCLVYNTIARFVGGIEFDLERHEG